MSMQHDNRVIVVGAGPVGAVMTLALVRKGIPVTLLEIAAGRRRGSARRHHTSADRRDAGRARPREGSILRGAVRRHVGAAVPFPRPPHRRAVRGLRHQPAQRRNPLPVRAAMGAIQARAGRAAAHQGERPRRGALLGAGHRARTACRPCRRDHSNEAGESEKLRARYVIGTDGGSSTVRRLAEIEFEGFTYPERFIKIGTTFDFGAPTTSFCTRNYFSDPNEWLNLFKVKGNGPPGIWRGVIPVPAGRVGRSGAEPGGASQRRLQGIHPRQRRLRNPLSRALCACISAWPRPSTRAACCSPATAPTSTIRSAAWA